jgi:hypothetical protein
MTRIEEAPSRATGAKRIAAGAAGVVGGLTAAWIVPAPRRTAVR